MNMLRWVSNTLVQRRQKKSLNLTDRLSGVLGTREKVLMLDVGGGGPLKAPWAYLSPRYLLKISFDPDVDAIPGESVLKNYPICVSDKACEKILNLAVDPRNSSLQGWDPEFKARFFQKGYETRKQITVQCESIDRIIEDDMDPLAADVNAEGHDFMVLNGARKTLKESLYLVKIEFEFFNCYREQGSFGQIQDVMIDSGFELVHLEDLEYGREKTADSLMDRGTLLWGKMYWVKKNVTPLLTGAACRDHLFGMLSLDATMAMAGKSLATLKTASRLQVITENEHQALAGIIRAHYKKGRIWQGFSQLRRLVSGVK